MAGGGGGQLLAVVHGQRLGCFAVEGVGKAGTPKGLCPGLPWVQRLCPCLERVTVRDGAGRDAGIWYWRVQGAAPDQTVSRSET